MPELAEVELARRIWAQAEGQRVTKVTTNPKARIFRDLPAPALQSLVGQLMEGSHHHGKRMYFTFNTSTYLEVHLGMSGKVYRAEHDYAPQKHDHLILTLENCSLILNDYRMFGRVMMHEGTPPWELLPPDPLSRKFTLPLVKEIVAKRPKKVLKGALLDQSLFPGVGNWMADEICWRLQSHPAAPLGSIPPENLYKEVKAVCKGAIKYVADKNESALAKPQALGFSAGGYVAEVPPKNWLFQHRWKAGGSCPKCKSPLERDTIATRTTAWCEQCQK